ncbi:MAG: hypothetical protein CMH83_09010 [Nocardioides sp.]|nr:hypothetical protein [Nocardioides sp.]
MTDRMLQGRRFVRLHHGVWGCRDDELGWDGRLQAATLALPVHAHPTGLTRIRMLGLDEGPAYPLRFVVEGDLHLDLEDVFLHRTRRLAPLDGVGVTPAAAFLAYCARARTVDAVRVGDWLLHHGHASAGEIRDLALSALWRDGADEALCVVPLLDARCRSLPESEVRVVLSLAGLPAADPNRPIELEQGITAIGDLVYREHRLVVEYEGGHHQEDRGQYVGDIDRYELFRTHGVDYVQVTRERLRQPRVLVGTVHRRLVALGYDGPAPVLGPGWLALWQPLHALLGSRAERLRRRERWLANPSQIRFG